MAGGPIFQSLLAACGISRGALHFHRGRLIRPPPVPGALPHSAASHEPCANQNAHQCLLLSPAAALRRSKNISFNCAMLKKGRKRWGERKRERERAGWLVRKL